MSPVERYFTPSLSGTTDKAARLISLQIKFSLISIGFAIGYFIMSYFNGFVLARCMMTISSLLFLLQLFAFKFQYISLQATSHFFVFVCWLIVLVLSVALGGLHSFVLPWLSLIPILGLVLLSKKATWLWGALGFVTVVVLAQVDASQFVPANLLITGNSLLTASLQIGLQFIILTLTFIFDRQQNALIEQIEQQNEKLRASKEEITEQNEQLIQSQQELASQRNTVEKQNHTLEEARKVIEAQHQILLEKNEGLEIEIKKRTQELVDYNQQLEQFAFMSSHNLRAPIVRILGLGNLLEITNDKTDVLKIKHNLIASARELDRVVKDLNTILEIRKNTVSSVMEINLAEELSLIKLNLEKDISETDTTLLVDFSAAPTIRTVRPYLDSIIINLLSNAIKYRHPDRKPMVEIKTVMRGDLFFLEVKDNGVGIDLEIHGPKIFTLYSRFHNHVEGKGLGLYLVKTQCEALGGNITVSSQPTLGSIFTASFRPST